jgi:hypothetical protein
LTLAYLRLQQEAPKKKLPLPTIITLLPSFSISCRKKNLLEIIDPTTAGGNQNNNKHPQRLEMRC